MNIPNILTVLRVVLIPIFVLIYLLPFKWVYLTASIIFAIACITDWFDGYLARQWNQTTPFGAFLDPVADKLIVAVALVLLVGSHSRVIHGTMVNLCLTLSAIIIVGREIVVSALREWMAELGARTNVAVSKLGKWKTAAQMLALVILLANPPKLTTWVITGYILLGIAAILTIWSMIHYLMAAWPYLTSEKTTETKQIDK